MLLTRSLESLAAISLVSGVMADSVGSSGHQGAAGACALLHQKVPHIVHFPGTLEYLTNIDHYEEVATQDSACGVTPKTVEDVQTIIRTVGRDDVRSPFAIKSGGHALNPGFSSTLGVQISLQNFLDFEYDSKAQTVRLGSAWTWDAVYEKLQPENVTVVGARISGVGMGALFGGGFSWYTNQHGLAVDNVIAFDLVLPNGTYVNVKQNSHPDLYFGLRGGLNNFGIVTGATLRTWPSGRIWGGNIEYSIYHKDQVIKAVEEFSMNNKDEKAQLEATYTVTSKRAFWQVLFFYDAPVASPIPFRRFLSIPSTKDTTKITTHSQLVKDSKFPPVIGSYFHTVPIIHYTARILDVVEKTINASYARSLADERSAGVFYWIAEPFFNHYSHISYPSAFPHSTSNPTTPSCFWFNYTSPRDVEYFRQLIKDAGTELQKAVVQEGQGHWDDVKYPNYAVKGTAVEEVYGKSLDRMRALKARIDRKDVMGLQGEGFLI
ncbi:CAZyme family AA7 [Agaricus bisporus var. burnettii]|uniref:CAZyme family AA7 n=1 Tax=Agaricus bisporus var. burnettii TaxID=192524 RepID=A0A8H7F9U1_AGABI|nr:CAZyme family AA7 [Agaricus bisporus var. burnettii]